MTVISSREIDLQVAQSDATELFKGAKVVYRHDEQFKHSDGRLYAGHSPDVHRHSFNVVSRYRVRLIDHECSEESRGLARS